mgnify:CR=1 FL=1
MADKSAIEWTDATWNPIRGCRRVSPGCQNCYAERTAARFCGPGQAYDGLIKLTKDGPRWSGKVKFVAEHLYDPLRWKTPRRIFVNSMSDLFYEEFTDAERDQVLAVMLLAPRHTFQVLTKRAATMRRYLSDPGLYERVLAAAGVIRNEFPKLAQVGISNPATRPAPWIWWGVSVENQAAADERVPELLQTPAAMRFLSCEPLLGPVELRHLDADAHGHRDLCQVDALTGRHTDMGRPCPDVGRIGWVIVGCESGPGSRPCDVAWLRRLRDQCAAAGVPCFLKQATNVPACIPAPAGLVTKSGWIDVVDVGPGSHLKAGGVIGAPYLDGQQHLEFPEAV